MAQRRCSVRPPWPASPPSPWPSHRIGHVVRAAACRRAPQQRLLDRALGRLPCRDGGGPRRCLGIEQSLRPPCRGEEAHVRLRWAARRRRRPLAGFTALVISLCGRRLIVLSSGSWAARPSSLPVGSRGMCWSLCCRQLGTHQGQ